MKLVHTSAPEGRTPNLDDEALSWVVRLTSGDANEDEQAAFRTWRDQSTDHAAALARARTLWAQVGTAVPRARGAPAPGGRRRWAAALSAAASLVLCISLGNAYLSDWRYDHSTDQGERRTVVLPDGSRMILAGGSAVDVTFDDGVRSIDLARGRALFEVVHDRTRPFVVRASGHLVRDIGTVFDVAHAGAGVDVTVSEGAVEVSANEKRTLMTRDHSVTLVGGRTGPIRTVDAAASIAWTRGRLILEDKSLREIVAAIRPHYQGRLFLLNRSADDRRMSVVVDLDHVDDWLAGLAVTENVRLHRIGSWTVLT